MYSTHSKRLTLPTLLLSIQKSDYPDKYDAALKVGETSSTKGDFNNHLRDVATEIEAREGKKIELIRRRILKSQSMWAYIHTAAIINYLLTSPTHLPTLSSPSHTRMHTPCRDTHTHTHHAGTHTI